MRKFQGGFTIPAHSHYDANEWAYILSGEWEESGVAYGTGTLFFAPKGVRHGPHVARTAVISLTVFDGPLTVGCTVNVMLPREHDHPINARLRASAYGKMVRVS